MNTLGYDITGIDSVFGWSNAGGGRSNQGYSIELTFVDNSTATLLNAVHWEPNSPSPAFWTVVSFANYGGGALFSDTYNLNGGGNISSTSVLASGVKAISFDIANNANAGGNVIAREFDVFGVATIPEPSSIVLIGVALISLVALRRRADLPVSVLSGSSGAVPEDFF